ncbi:MAG: hypothetical protein ACYDGY_09300 [Acidimicrobiales bacterium]
MKRTRSLNSRRLRTLRSKFPDQQIIVTLANVSDGMIGVDPYKHSMIRLRYAIHDSQDASRVGSSASRQTNITPGAESDPTRIAELFNVLAVDRSTEVDAEDPAFPDAITVAGALQAHGLLAAGYARTLLKEIAIPLTRNLLGFSGWSAPYWDFNGQYPSTALIKKVDYVMLFLRDDGSSWVRLGSRNVDAIMPTSDSGLRHSLELSRDGTLQGKELESALGFRPHYLLVALDTPHDGHCYKTLAALIPRP